MKRKLIGIPLAGSCSWSRHGGTRPRGLSRRRSCRHGLHPVGRARWSRLGRDDQPEPGRCDRDRGRGAQDRAQTEAEASGSRCRSSRGRHAVGRRARAAAGGSPAPQSRPVPRGRTADPGRASSARWVRARLRAPRDARRAAVDGRLVRRYDGRLDLSRSPRSGSGRARRSAGLPIVVVPSCASARPACRRVCGDRCRPTRRPSRRALRHGDRQRHRERRAAPSVGANAMDPPCARAT
jgi:hypothetical protein